MKLFISWSGERSQAFAQALREWLTSTSCWLLTILLLVSCNRTSDQSPSTKSTARETPSSSSDSQAEQPAAAASSTPDPGHSIPVDYGTLIQTGITAAKNGDREEAIKSFDMAIRLDSNNPTAWYNKGVALFEGDTHGAEECFQKVIELCAGNPFATVRVESHDALLALRRTAARVLSIRTTPIYADGFESGKDVRLLLDNEGGSTLRFKEYTDYRWHNGLLTCSVKDLLRGDNYTEVIDVDPTAHLEAVQSRSWRNAKIEFQWNSKESPLVASGATAYLNGAKIGEAKLVRIESRNSVPVVTIRETHLSAGKIIYEAESHIELLSFNARREVVSASGATPYIIFRTWESM